MTLERKVHALNEVNRVAKVVLESIRPQLDQYVGQKIYLADGSKSKKFIVNFPAVEFNKFENKAYAKLHNCYIHKSYHSIFLSVTGCFKSDEVGCFYEDVQIWLGNLDDSGQVLTTVRPEEYQFEYYEADTVRKQLKQKKELEKQLSDLKSKLRSFSDGYFD